MPVPLDLTLIALVFCAAVYLALALAVARGRSPAACLPAALAAGLAWTLPQALLRAHQLGLRAGADPFTLEKLVLYGLPGLSLLLLWQTRSFLRRSGHAWGRAALGTGLALAGAAVYEGAAALPAWVSRWQAGHALVVAGWAALLAACVWATLSELRRARVPLHRNRTTYWAAALILAAAGQALVLARQAALGNLLHLLATLVAASVTVTYTLPDLRQAARRLFLAGVGLGLALVLYTGAYYAAARFLPPATPPLWAGLGLAAALVVVGNPILGLARRMAAAWIGGERYDPARALSAYSQAVAGLQDLEALSGTVTRLAGETLGVRHGALLTVSEEPGSPGAFLLRPVQPAAENENGGDAPRLNGRPTPPGEAGHLSPESPLVDFLVREHRPLAQYEVDLLPRFAALDPSERAWLAALDMDVFVPIYTQGQWRGLLALGPKTSGDRYFEDDLRLLQSMADQTAVALENARLYDDLKHRNAENERLYRELKGANDSLARLDKAKSDFLNIASHELRTPLTQIIGYNDMVTEMLRENTLQAASTSQRSAGQHMTESVRRAARRLEEIVDTMFEVSRLDTHTLEMTCAPVSVASVVAIAAESWHEALAERKITLQARGLAELPTLMADGRRLVQVFARLIQNAIQNTPDGGVIHIIGRVIAPEDGRASEDSRAPDDGGAYEDERAGKNGHGPGVAPGLEAAFEPGPHVEVVVADSGIGIPRDELERIFDKFYRTGSALLHSSGPSKFKGAGPGLGLTIARGVVEAHGGRIWAESAGRDEERLPGSRFYVVLPIRKVEDLVEERL